ncbi:hypothetical protein EMIT0P218_120189 [Pseudomonas sp. IT-P218]
MCEASARRARIGMRVLHCGLKDLQPSNHNEKIPESTAPPVGASLLAIADCQSTSLLNLKASSPAGWLPQWIAESS